MQCTHPLLFDALNTVFLSHMSSFRDSRMSDRAVCRISLRGAFFMRSGNHRVRVTVPRQISEAERAPGRAITVDAGDLAAAAGRDQEGAVEGGVIHQRVAVAVP